MSGDWASLLGTPNPGPGRRALAALFADWQRRRWARETAEGPGNDGVVLVGSPSFGGSGKTPIVALLARRLLSRGIRVAIIGHAYGARGAGRTTWTASGRFESDGDEAVELVRSLPGVPVQLGRDRRAAVEAVRAAAEVVLIDGGLGAADVPPASRILVEDATLPPNVFPAGYCRFRAEDVPGVALRWRHKVDEPDARPGEADVKSVWRARHLWAPDGVSWPLSTLGEGRWTALSGIARPASFRFALERAGARLVEHRVFGDHATFPGRALRLPPGTRGVTTAKDAARLPPGHGLWVLSGEVEIVTGADRLDALLDAVRVRRGAGGGGAAP